MIGIAVLAGQLLWVERSDVVRILSLDAESAEAFPWLPGARGAIKTYLWQFGTALLALLAALRVLLVPPTIRRRRLLRTAWGGGQVLLCGWAALSLYSVTWAPDAELAFGQAMLYVNAVAFAVALGWTLTWNGVRVLIAGYAVTAILCCSLAIVFDSVTGGGGALNLPVGGAGPLGLSLVPAVILGVALLCHAAPLPLRIGGGGLAALATYVVIRSDSQSALLVLVLGLLVFAAIRLRARRALATTISVAAIGLVVGVGAWAFMAPAADDFAGVRLRKSLWRYAAILWQQSPYLGIGAGGYTRAATRLAAPDAAFDPEAFQRPLYDTALSETFQGLAELGLVGGVAFVAAMLAVLGAIRLLIVAPRERRREWLVASVCASIITLLLAAQFTDSLRNPGPPAVLFAIVAAGWAILREEHRARASLASALAVYQHLPDPRHWSQRDRWAIAAAFVVVGVLQASLATQHVRGAAASDAARAAMRIGEYQAADRAWNRASELLLPPSAKLIAVVEGLRAAIADAERITRDAETSWTLKNDVNQRLYQRLRLCDVRVPAYEDVAWWTAQSAERLEYLFRDRDVQLAANWRATRLHWIRTQLNYNPYHVAAALEWSRLGPDTADRLLALRNSLRLTSTRDPEWLEAFDGVVRRPDAAAALGDIARYAQPINPQTDRDSIIASLAPESLRLIAAAHVVQNRPDLALVATERALSLYAAVGQRLDLARSATLEERARLQTKRSQRASEPPSATEQ